MKNTAIVIPARMDSSRFPGKPMKKINGIPMIGHCYYRANMSKLKNSVYVATCDKEISDYIKSIGGNVIMTSHNHQRASERVGEAINIIEKMLKKTIDIVVLYQGDEPMVDPQDILKSIELKKIFRSHIINSYCYINDDEDPTNKNIPKVITNENNDLIYISRALIPNSKKSNL